MRVVAQAAALMVLSVIARSPAQDNRSLTDFEYARLGQEITVPTENEAAPESLEERLVLARASIKALTEALAISNSEGEVFKRQTADLQLKLDAYGLAGLEKEPGKLEQRLLSAVRDLRVLKKQNEDATLQIVRLSEAIQMLIKTTDGINPQSRMAVEAELRKTNEVLGSPAVAKAKSLEASLSDGMVVDLKEDLSLIVANIGTKHGVKVGMPFQVWRENKLIGTVRIVDARDRISGGIIQNLETEKEPVKTGDRLRVDARQ
jgi:hypothetical protein